MCVFVRACVRACVCVLFKAVELGSQNPNLITPVGVMGLGAYISVCKKTVCIIRYWEWNIN